MTRLVGLVRLPASAAPTRDRPDALSAPEEEPAAIPGTLVDVTRFVFVGLPLADAQTYIQAHPPALPYTNSGPAQTLDRTGISSVGYSYGEPDSAAWSDASLEITVAPAGAHSSVWRIDGYAFVVDPSPLRVQAVMPGFRLTGGGGCPAVDNHGTVQNPGLDLGRELLPGGAPRAGLLCHYDAHGVLSEQSRLAAPAALTFASEVRGSVLSHPDGSEQGCGLAAADLRTVIAFSFPEQPVIAISAYDDGCQLTVDNGVISAKALPNLRRQLGGP